MSKFTFERRSSHWPYQETAGLIIISPENLILVADTQSHRDIFKIPEEAIEPGESAKDAAFRKLFEKIGISEGAIEREGSFDSRYDYPANSNHMQGFRGQSFKWLLVRTQDTMAIDHVDLSHAGEDQESLAQRWVTPQEALKLAHNNHSGDVITAQRQEIYREAFVKFGLLPNRAAEASARRKARTSEIEKYIPRISVPARTDGLVDVSVRSMGWVSKCLADLVARLPQDMSYQVERLENAVERALARQIMVERGIKADVKDALTSVRHAYAEIGPAHLRNFHTRSLFMRLTTRDIVERAKEVVATIPAPKTPPSKSVKKRSAPPKMS